MISRVAEHCYWMSRYLERAEHTASFGKEARPRVGHLHRLEQEPKERALRRHVLNLLVRQAGKPFAIDEVATDSTRLKRTYAPVYTWFTKQHPDLAQALQEEGDDDPAVWNKLLAAVDWSSESRPSPRAA